MAELKYWYIQEGVAWGTVYGSERFKDGTNIHTSEIKDIVATGKSTVELHTLNSVYKADYKTAWFDEFDKDVNIFNFEKLKEVYFETYFDRVAEEDNVTILLQPAVKAYIWRVYLRKNGKIKIYSKSDTFISHYNSYVLEDKKEGFKLFFPELYIGKRRIELDNIKSKLPVILCNIGEEDAVVYDKEKEIRIAPGKDFKIMPSLSHGQDCDGAVTHQNAHIWI